jgi:Ni,Fe-hydrogenase I cytochrome b subunit
VSVTSLDSKFYSKSWTAYPPAMDFIRRTELLAQSAPVVEQSAYIRRPLGILAATYLPLLLIAVALSALVLSRETHRKRLGWLVALVLFVYSYNLANCLEVAVIHSLQNSRYATVQMYFVILAQFLAILLILEILLGSLVLIGTSAQNDK